MGGGSNQSDVERLLTRHPAIARGLDERALQQIRVADPMRAVEIIEDVAARPGIRNLSAFVAKALSTHPQKRGHKEGSLGRDAPPLENPKRRRLGAPADTDPRELLDEDARKRLDEADPERAAEILEELSQKSSEIRNPSAFVAQALRQYPQ